MKILFLVLEFPSGLNSSNLYVDFRDDDGFLYMRLIKENVFG